ncbi:NAD synthase [Ignavibacterium album JCM 16511]|uniref:NH(3)-dependent NAD(+) synthetase n=1 Tax=Ignavibacterium album (strain DSM 19864 / JCM 16511 / NBRC 101810 / Mat9-16) TaxID=945713 RepID=I0AMI7_IGNAJ|nr:NAD(+) synthase [Ignavibacterium album]AFH50194.1 NAD synthase [Ignavibacterium album JCM 16511]
MAFQKDSILLNPKAEAERIIKELREIVAKKIHKRGAVVGVSGGIDSSVVLALCANAFGPEKVLALMMPDKDSSPDSLNLAKKLVDKFKVPYLIEDITKAAEGFGAYKRRDQAVKKVFPEYDESYKMKIVLPKDDEAKGKLNVYYVTIIAPNGEEKTARLPLTEYLQIVAASNFKQRSRTNFLYYHAEARNFAVIGTGNKNEHEQGFFVKYGDGGADIKPIAHLFKTQVYQLAEYLGVPEEIQKRTPTTDTYSAEQTQEEFFFRLPYSVLDRIWFGWEKGFSSKEIAEALNLSEAQVEVVINDIKQKIKTTEYLRMEPISLG